MSVEKLLKYVNLTFLSSLATAAAAILVDVYPLFMAPLCIGCLVASWMFYLKTCELLKKGEKHGFGG